MTASLLIMIALCGILFGLIIARHVKHKDTT